MEILTVQEREIVQEIPEIEWSWTDSQPSDHAQGGSQQLQCLHWCFLTFIPLYVPVRVERFAPSCSCALDLISVFEPLARCGKAQEG